MAAALDASVCVPAHTRWRAAQRILIAVTLLLGAAWWLLSTLAGRLPPLTEEQLAVLRHFPPRTLPHLAAQRDVLLAYAAAAPVTVLCGYCATYILMQAFAIPGTIMLSLLAGGLYGVARGSLLVAAVSTAGSCACYCMSWAVGQPLAHALWPDRLDKFAAEVASRRRQLLNYIIFLRVTPILPNTVINVCSPVVGVPLLPFALAAKMADADDVSLLLLPNHALDVIAMRLDDPKDRIRLASCCTALYEASPRWFSQSLLDAQIDGQLEGWEAHARWLRRVAAPVRLDLRPLPERALEALAIVAGVGGVQLASFSLHRCQSASVLAQLLASFRASLTRLDLSVTDVRDSWAQLGPLPAILELDLTACGLTVLPLQLSGCAALTSVTLSDNWIRQGWEALLPLTRLRSLVLVDCNLAALPAPLEGLLQLTRLDVGWSRVQHGWERLRQLTALQDLQLEIWAPTDHPAGPATTDLPTAVPDSLSGLTALTRLCLTGSNVQHGWERLRPLRRLRYLSLSSCQLSALPPFLAGMTRLSRLDLGGNPMQQGWEQLAALRQLEHLDIGTCQLSALPASLASLTGLTRLGLGGNPIAHGWELLGPLCMLRTLGLHHCGLTALPAHLGLLTALEELDLEDTRIQTGWNYLPRSLRTLRLEVYDDLPTVLPERLACLTLLRFLQLSGRQVTGGWQHLCCLAQLQDLSLGGGACLPPELSLLTGLTCLYLDDAPTDGWEHLLLLPSLRELCLEFELPSCLLNLDFGGRLAVHANEDPVIVI